MTVDRPTLYPLLFEPVYKDYIWGGRNLARFGRVLPPGRVAEIWDIAAHKAGTSRIANGPWRGIALTELQELLGEALVGTYGTWALERRRFPLLVKLLDASERLSVQVHPDDAYAKSHEGNELGKSEMWVVLSATDDAAIIFGVTEGTTPDNFREALVAGRLEERLHRLPLTAGDVVCVPAGTLHALLGGLVVAEIQQNSNATYRVYDWNRTDDAGKPRPLHVEKAMDVINFAQVEPGLPVLEATRTWRGAQTVTLCRNKAFITERITLRAGQELAGATDGSSLEIFGVLKGRATLSGGGRTVTLRAVTFTLLPAAMGDYRIETGDDAVFLRTTLPAPGEAAP